MTAWKVKIDGVLDIPEAEFMNQAMQKIEEALSNLGDTGGTRVSITVPLDRWREGTKALRQSAKAPKR